MRRVEQSVRDFRDDHDVRHEGFFVGRVVEFVFGSDACRVWGSFRVYSR